MSETYTAWWIDDDENREKSAELLGDGGERLAVEFTPVRQVVEELGLKEEPADGEGEATDPSEAPIVPDGGLEIILLDWKLYEDGGFGGTGKSIVGLLRDKFPGLPMYGFSSEQEIIDRSVFDATFDVDEIVGAADQIVADIDDYRLIENSGDSIQTLVDCLEPPETDAESVERLVPREFTDGLTDETAVDFAAWVRDDFLTRPGLLFDRTWTATKLGVTPEVLNEREVLLDADVEDQTYSGVFEPQETLWWKSKLIDTLVRLDMENGGDGQFTNTWEKGAELLGADPEERSTCAVCGEQFPETVAAADAGGKAKYPVHFRCSNVYKSRTGSYADFRVANEL